MLTVIMILLGIAVLLLLDGILENYFPIAKEYHIQSEKIKEDNHLYNLVFYDLVISPIKHESILLRISLLGNSCPNKNINLVIAHSGVLS